MNLKEYFKGLDKLKLLKKLKSDTRNFEKQVNYGREIRDLEYKLFDFAYGIDNYLNDDERQYIKLKYINKLGTKALETIFHKQQSTLWRYEQKINNKLEKGGVWR
jgi:hypothetical protein